MATKEEGIQKDTWWLNELESLGVTPKVKNELHFAFFRALYAPLYI